MAMQSNFKRHHQEFIAMGVHNAHMVSATFILAV